MIRPPSGSLPLDRFWSLVRDLAPVEGQSARLDTTFADLDDEELRTWVETLVSQARALNTAAHLIAAELAFGGLGGDDFADVRITITLRGREDHESFLGDPDSLASYARALDFSMGAVALTSAYDLYRQRTGRDMWDDSSDVVPLGQELSGNYINSETELRRLLPRLWAMGGRR